MKSTNLFRRAQRNYDLAFTLLCALTAAALSQAARFGFSKTGIAWLAVALACICVAIVPPLRFRTRKQRQAGGGSNFAASDQAFGVQSPVEIASLTRLRETLETYGDANWRDLESSCALSHLSLLRRYLKFRRRAAASRSLESAKRYQSRQAGVAEAVSMLLDAVKWAQASGRQPKHSGPPRPWSLPFTAVAAKVAGAAYVYRDLLSSKEYEELYGEFAEAVRKSGSVAHITTASQLE